MVTHVILWQLKDDLTEAERSTVKEGIKAALEGLLGQVPSLLSVKVTTETLPSSNADVMLACTYEDEAGLLEYAKHPAHVAAANQFVRPFVKTRLCFDTIE